MSDDSSLKAFFEETGIPEERYSIEPKIVHVIGQDFREGFSREGILKLQQFCTRLRQFTGFAETIKSMRNPPQFGSTAFELGCATFCLDQYAPTDFRFNPEVNVGGKRKFPDFAFTITSGHEIYCECKSLHSLNRIKQSRALKLLKVLQKHVRPLITPEWRLEFHFERLPMHWNANLGKQMWAAGNELIRRRYIQKELSINFPRSKFCVKLSRRDEEPFFRSEMNAAELDAEERPVLLISEKLHLETDILSIIHDALSQLPTDRPTMIFLNPISQPACETAMLRFATTPRDGLVAVHAFTDRPRTFWNPRSILPPSLFGVPG